MPEDAKPAPEPFDRYLQRGKDIVVLSRDAALLALAALLIVFPVKFNDMLSRAGFEEGSVAGFKWKNQLVHSDDELRAAQAAITTLKEQLARATVSLKDAQAAVPSGAVKDAVAKVAQENTQVVEATKQAQASISRTLTANQPLIEKAQASLPVEGEWAVVIGSDPTLEGARGEVAWAAKNGIPDAKLFRRNGFFATIALADDRAQAAQLLDVAKKRRASAYLTNLARWCKSRTDKDGYTDCASP